MGITGSIAAVKVPELIRLLVEAPFDVHCVLTRGAAQFVTPLSLATLSGNPVHLDMFGEDAFRMPHLSLAEKADVMLVAPATGAILGKFVHGISDDMVTLTYVTTKAPVLVAPAMHDSMWEHATTKRNVDVLTKQGIKFIGPTTGKLADGKKAVGRMAEPTDILKSIQKSL